MPIGTVAVADLKASAAVEEARKRVLETAADPKPPETRALRQPVTRVLDLDDTSRYARVGAFLRTIPEISILQISAMGILAGVFAAARVEEYWGCRELFDRFYLIFVESHRWHVLASVMCCAKIIQLYGRVLLYGTLRKNPSLRGNRGWGAAPVQVATQVAGPAGTVICWVIGMTLAVKFFANTFPRGPNPTLFSPDDAHYVYGITEPRDGVTMKLHKDAVDALTRDLPRWTHTARGIEALTAAAEDVKGAFHNGNLHFLGGVGEAEMQAMGGQVHPDYVRGAEPISKDPFLDISGVDALTADQETEIERLLRSADFLGTELKRALYAEYKTAKSMVWTSQSAKGFIDYFSARPAFGGHGDLFLNPEQLQSMVGDATAIDENHTGLVVSQVPSKRGNGNRAGPHTLRRPRSNEQHRAADAQIVEQLRIEPPLEFFGRGDDAAIAWMKVQGGPALEAVLKVIHAHFARMHKGLLRDFNRREDGKKTDRREAALKMKAAREKVKKWAAEDRSRTLVDLGVKGGLGGILVRLFMYMLDVLRDGLFVPPMFDPMTCFVKIPNPENEPEETTIDGVFEILVTEWNDAVERKLFDSPGAMLTAIGGDSPTEARTFDAPVMDPDVPQAVRFPAPWSRGASATAKFAAMSRVVDAKRAYDEFVRMDSAAKIDLARKFLSGSTDLQMDKGFYWIRMFLYEKRKWNDGSLDFPEAAARRLFDLIKMGTVPGRHDACQRYSTDEDRNECDAPDELHRTGPFLLDFCIDAGIVATLPEGIQGNLGRMHYEFTQRGKLVRICSSCAGVLQKDTFTAARAALPLAMGQKPVLDTGPKQTASLIALSGEAYARVMAGFAAASRAEHIIRAGEGEGAEGGD